RCRGKGNLDIRAAIGVFEGDLEIITQVGSASRTTAAGAAPTEDIAKGAAEYLLEDVIDVGIAGAAASERSLTAAVHALMAEPVIGGALLRIRQDGIGLRDLLEAGRGLFAAVVA